MLDVMRCLDEELKQVPAHSSKAYKVLMVLVEASIKALEQDNLEPQAFDRPTLLDLCESKAKATRLDPTRWLKKDMLETFIESRWASIIERIDAKGLTHVPAVGSNDDGGGSGNQRFFWLKTRPIQSADLTQHASVDPKPIAYTRTEIGEVRPSWLLRLIFKNGELKNRSLRGLSLLILILSGMFFLLLWVSGGLWSVGALDQALTFRQLCIAVFMLGCTWLIWNSAYQPWLQLVDYRIVKAPDLLLAVLEDSAEIEMYRDADKNQWTRFVRFSGDCSLCNGRVVLMPGKPDHLMPLVGRCSESPHAHVFSFDRARLSGAYIGPLLNR
jgi:hypothetical protein